MMLPRLKRRRRRRKRRKRKRTTCAHPASFPTDLLLLPHLRCTPWQISFIMPKCVPTSCFGGLSLSDASAVALHQLHIIHTCDASKRTGVKAALASSARNVYFTCLTIPTRCAADDAWIWLLCRTWASPCSTSVSVLYDGSICYRARHRSSLSHAGFWCDAHATCKTANHAELQHVRCLHLHDVGCTTMSTFLRAQASGPNA
jgi:hypothetical protein